MFEGIPLATLSPLGALMVAVLLVLTGRLVARKFLDDARADAKEWRDSCRAAEEAHRVSETARADLQAQLREMTNEKDLTVVSLLRSITEHGPGRSP